MQTRSKRISRSSPDGVLISDSRSAIAPATERRAAIVVAVSAAGRRWDALAWAAAEAYDRCRPLQIVHVVRWPPLAFDPFGALPADLGAEALAAGGLTVEEAESHARSIAPSLRIDSVVQMGNPASGILRAGAAGAMIVLGQRHGRRLPRLLVSSTVTCVARRAQCPVAVIGLHDDLAGPSAARVVALLDSAADAVRTLDFAFDAAQRRGIGVTVMRSTGTGGIRQDATQELLAVYRPAYPTVDILEQIPAQPIRAALVGAARGAALVAVGASLRRQVRRAVLHDPETSPVGPVVLVGSGHASPRIAT